jgi:uncharacterized phiE125 gp8 family phage protein
MVQALIRIADAAAEPVTLDEAKAHLRVTDDAEDAYIAGLIKTAREAVESFTGRTLIAQSWVLQIDAWPRDACWPWIDLPRPPLIAVTGVTVYDAAGAPTLWDPADYGVDKNAAPARLYRAPGAAWPEPGRPVAGIEIAFTAGYGDSGAAVPAALRQGLLLQLAHLFENREPAAFSGAALAMLTPYRIFRL